MDFAEEVARKEECTSLRLDVVKGNIPAENLYRKCGYKYVGTTSLGYEDYDLPWFNLYEKIL
ncbi:MAG: GNAT family N-acetyltransferase [Traorella sp.]